MKNTILILTLFFSTIAFAQKFDNVEATPAQKEQAEQLTSQYNDELSFNSKQRRLFNDKVEEFLAKQNAVLVMEGTNKEKNVLLQAFYKEEIGEMGDILTRPQLEVKGKIQPLLQLK